MPHTTLCRTGARRRPRAGLHRRHAGLEKRPRAPPRRAHHGHRPRRAQGGEMELALLRRRGPGLVSQLSLLHEVRESGILPRDVAAPAPARSEEHTSDLQSLMRKSYADFCLKKKITI